MTLRSQIDDIYRLSPSQQGMLFHGLSTPESGMYFEQLILAAETMPDPDRFRRVWQLLIDGNPVLRTSFVWEDVREPVQVVHGAALLEMEVHDLPELPEAEQAAWVDRWAEADRRRGFDLGKPPLLRWSLLRAPGGRGWVVFSYHHILLDGWSAVSLIGEAAELFAALDRGEPARPLARRPFRDYVAWLRRQDLAAAEVYWRERLAGVSAPTRLAFDRDPAAPPGAHGRLDVRLGAAATAALERLARSRHLTLNTLLQGAWALILSRYSGADDVVFGVTVSGRPPELKGVESMLGCFVNTLPARVAVRPGERLVPWLEAIQADQLEMRRHEHTPLVEVRRWSQVPSGTPLFETILVFENIEATAERHTRSAPRIQRTNFPLVLMVEPEGERLLLRFGWDRARFAEDDVRRLQASLLRVLETLPAGADAGRLGEIGVLGAAERERLLGAWSRSPDRYPEGRPVHRQVEAQARRTPERIAIELDGTLLTYGELVARAHALAARLRAAGAGPEVPVAVALERSPELVVALLAVLLAGSAYLPLDLEHPDERLALLLEDAWQGGAGPRVVVADPEAAARLRHPGLTVVAPRAESRAAAEGEPAPPAPSLAPDHPAYVLYTSGTTGRPKGVVVSHRALANRLEWARHHDVTGPAAFLHKTTAGFDVSVLEIFLPLVLGGRVVMARPGGQRDLAYLVELMGRARVSHASFPPAVYPVLLAEPGLDACLDLEVLYTAGEAVAPDLPARVARRLRHLPDLVFENRYGPTETTIGALGWRCRPEAAEQPVPIGRPLAGARIYLAGADLRPVPAGVPGELCLGGPSLARGYLGRPARTAAAFVPNPFSDEGGERLYRTGDLARFRPDGAVEFLGRIDRQVKVRGFRIELEEVELALARHPGVREAVVIDRVEPGGGARHLVAYWAAEPRAGEPAPGAEALRSFLAETLPSYMVPGVWVELEALPRTTSYKVDAAALPEPQAAQAEPNEGFTAPRDEAERAIAEAFARVLGVERVGAGDDFFALGGHSLHLVRLHNELRKLCPTMPGLAAIARDTTVAGMARLLARAERGEREPAREAGPSVDELRAAARLAPGIRPASAPEPNSEPNSESNSESGTSGRAGAWPADGRPAFLTGATGFLGAHLLHELLEQTPGPVLCLVRAADEAAGARRLRRALERRRLWREVDGDRIVPLVGDLAEPRFGLSEARFEELGRELGAVYHDGARLDLLRSFRELEAPNVGGTREAIRLACLGRAKPLVYVSTLSVFDADAYRSGERVADEDDPVDDPSGLAGGYAQTKWVAERLVREAGARGLPVSIFRPGVVAGNARTGFTNAEDFAGRLFRGCIQLGCTPAEWRGPARVSPVDFVSRAIVWLSLRPESRGRTFHPLNPHLSTVEELLAAARAFGYRLAPAPIGAWRRQLAAAVEAGEDNALAPLLALFAATQGAADGDARGAEGAAPRIRYECRGTSRALAAGPVGPPGPEEDLVSTFLADFVERGLLPPPAPAGSERELECAGGSVA